MRTSGIYQIQSKMHPDRIYIGSAVWVKDRWWRHLTDLRRNKHKNKKLQNHFNKYGEQDFQFSLILECDKEVLIHAEQAFIDYYNPWFNIAKIAGNSLGVKRSDETRKKYSEAKKGHIPWNKGKKASDESRLKSSNAHRGIRPWTRKPILQYDLEGNFIQEWDSAASVTLALHINNSNIHSCLTNNRRNAGGFIWKYKASEI